MTIDTGCGRCPKLRQQSADAANRWGNATTNCDTEDIFVAKSPLPGTRQQERRCKPDVTVNTNHLTAPLVYATTHFAGLPGWCARFCCGRVRQNHHMRHATTAERHYRCPKPSEMRSCAPLPLTTTPAAPPPPLLRRGIFCQKGRREAPTISFPSLGGVAVAKRLTGWSVATVAKRRFHSPP